MSMLCAENNRKLMEDKNNTSLIMAKRIKQLRDERGLSHEKLSKALLELYGVKISTDSLMNYEVTDPYHSKAGKNQGMRVEYLRSLADFYGVSTDYLLAISDIPSPDISIQATTQYTGISEKAARRLNHIKENSSPNLNLISDFNEIFDSAHFESLLFNLRDYRKAITAEAIYNRAWASFHSNDGVLGRVISSNIRMEFNKTIQMIIDSRKHDDTVNHFLASICHLDAIDDNGEKLAGVQIGSESFDISELCEQRVRKYLSLLMEDLTARVVNWDIEEAFKKAVNEGVISVDHNEMFEDTNN